MTIPSNEPRPEAIIEGLHHIREDLLAEHGNDLSAYVAAARQRQNASGRKVVSRPPVAMHSNAAAALAAKG